MTSRVVAVLGVAFLLLASCGRHEPAEVREASADVKLTVSGEAQIVGPTASPDGKLVALCLKVKAQKQNRFMRLAVLDLTASDLRFYNEPSGVGPEMWYGASWSPDSKSFAITFIEGERSNPEGFNVWVLRLGDGRMVRVLRLETGLCQYPRFSPDGRHLLVRDACSGNLAVLNMATRGHRFLLSGIANNDASGVHRLGYDWAGDGRTVYASRGYMGDAKPGIWSVGIAGERPESLLSGAYQPYALRTSPSGKHLAFVDRGEETNTLRVASLPGFEVHTVSEKAAELHVSWSKEGDRLAFCEKGTIVIWSPSKGGAVRIPISKGQPSFPSWVGPTDSMVFVFDEKELWLLDVGSREQKLLTTASDALKGQ